jgi:hypothetical protein
MLLRSENVKSRKYDSKEAALESLRKIGTLRHAGREKNFAIYEFTLNNGQQHILFIHDNGLVELYVSSSTPYVPPAKEEEKPKESEPDAYANGICECKALGRFRWQWVGSKHIYMCTKCNRPVYWKK